MQCQKKQTISFNNSKTNKMASELTNADLINRIKDLEVQNADLQIENIDLQMKNWELQNKLDVLTTERSPMPTISDEPNEYSYE